MRASRPRSQVRRGVQFLNTSSSIFGKVCIAASGVIFSPLAAMHPPTGKCNFTWTPVGFSRIVVGSNPATRQDERQIDRTPGLGGGSHVPPAADHAATVRGHARRVLAHLGSTR